MYSDGTYDYPSLSHKITISPWSFTTSKTTFNCGDAISYSVTYPGRYGDNPAWVGLYNRNDTPGSVDSIANHDVKSEGNKSLSVSAAKLKNSNTAYKLILFYDQGYTIKKKIDITIDHKSVKDTAVAATCTTTGKTEGSHCSVCGYVIKAQTTTSALNHSWNNGVVTTQPTCTAEGIKTFTCTRSGCGKTKTEKVAATGHKPGAAATCTTSQNCTVCKIQLAPAKGHTEVTDAAVAATCTTAGKLKGSTVRYVVR